MIESIELKGFKSFLDEDIELREFTLLTGLNSSGKSSVIQALLMAEEAMAGRNFLLDDHGTIKELTNINSQEFSLKFSDSDGNNLLLYGKEDNQTITTGKSGLKMPKVFYSEAGRYGSQSSIKVFNNTSDMDSKGSNLLKCIDTYADCTIPESLRHPDAQGETLLFNLKAWLGIISPGIDFSYSLQKLSDQSFSYFDDHRATNVGFGLSYTLPVLTSLLRASLENDSLVLLENPEAHLHPKGQTEIGKFIARCVDSGVNVVVETHSDHLFDGIRIYTKDHPSFASKLICYWFEQNAAKNTETARIRLDSKGKLADIAPKGFFDQFEIDAIELF